jgi:segregation and condensation protein B
MNEIKSMIEAALFVSGRSLDVEELAKVCGSGNLGLIRRCVEELSGEYEGRDSGILIQKNGEGYVMRVKGDLEKKIMHLVPETDIPSPALKTLALIAYEQPIKQSDIVRERGNKVYKYIKFLREQGLVEGRKCGRTRVLTVTPKFRDYFHIEDLKNFVMSGDDHVAAD